MVVFGNTEWPQYSLGDDEKWPIHGTLSFTHSVRLFCEEKGNWTAGPHVRAFRALDRGLGLRASWRACHLQPG